MTAIGQSPKRTRTAKTWIGVAFASIGVAHLLVGRSSHAQHIVHLLFGAAYLLPIVAAAAWLGARQALLLSAASSAVYLAHAGTAWAEGPMELANRALLAAVYVFVGVVSGALVAAANRERHARVEAERTAQRDAMLQSIASLSGALRERDDGTAAHCARVAEVAERLGKALGLATDRVKVLRLAALVHDVGKIGVRDDVLLKPGELTAEERVRVERHAVIAAEILRPIRGAEEISEIVLGHHECPDGSGYPFGLPEERIHPLSRILRVADVFAALLEPRIYKRSMRPEEVLERMRRLDGKLDPLSLAALGNLVSSGRLDDLG